MSKSDCTICRWLEQERAAQRARVAPAAEWERLQETYLRHLQIYHQVGM